MVCFKEDKMLYPSGELLFMLKQQQEKKDLRDFRLEGNMTQAELAAACGLTPSTIYMAEHKRPIAYRSAYKIVRALKAKGIQVEIQEIDWNVSA
jgi:DNA-binding XRE family transcriptional regulator